MSGKLKTNAETHELGRLEVKEKKGALPTGVKLPHAVDSAALAQGTDVRNVNHAGVAVESSIDLYLLAYELFSFFLIV